MDLYHTHDESEQYHSEIKTDMDVERLPSGKFESNKLGFELTLIAYNILRIIGQESLKKHDAPERKMVRHHRIQTIISNLMQIAGHLQHASLILINVHGFRLLQSVLFILCMIFWDMFSYNVLKVAIMQDKFHNYSDKP